MHIYAFTYTYIYIYVCIHVYKYIYICMYICANLVHTCAPWLKCMPCLCTTTHCMCHDSQATALGCLSPREVVQLYVWRAFFTNVMTWYMCQYVCHDSWICAMTHRRMYSYHQLCWGVCHPKRSCSYVCDMPRVYVPWLTICAMTLCVPWLTGNGTGLLVTPRGGSGLQWCAVA